MKCRTGLAEQFNNDSVLENMHLQELWKILDSNPQQNFLLKATDRGQAKHIITRLILSTDMAHHFQKLKALTEVRSDEDGPQKESNKWVLPPISRW